MVVGPSPAGSRRGISPARSKNGSQTNLQKSNKNAPERRSQSLTRKTNTNNNTNNYNSKQGNRSRGVSPSNSIKNGKVSKTGSPSNPNGNRQVILQSGGSE